MIEKEKKQLRNANLRYFFMGMGMYIIIYGICVFVLQMVHMMVSFSPYIELLCYVLFFIVDAFITRRVMRTNRIMAWARP